MVALNVFGKPLPEAPAPVAPLPGQLDLFSVSKLKYVPKESMLPMGARLFRKCNRCGDRNPVVYDGELSPRGCPVCCCPEYTILYEENHEMVTAVAKSSKTKVNKSVKGKAATSTPDLATSTDPTPSRSKVAVDAQVNRAGDFGQLVILELPEIVVEDNPRKFFDPIKLQELTDSVKELGLLQPLLVGDCDGVYELIAGGRRYRASQAAGLERVPCYVRAMTRDEIKLARLAENLAREDLTCLDEARGYQDALDSLGITQADLATRLGISASQISNRLRLLKLPESIQDKIISGEINASQGRDLVPWSDFPDVLEKIFSYCNSSDDSEEDDSALNVRSPSRLSPVEWQEAMTQGIWDASESVVGQRSVKAGWGSYDLRKLDAQTLEQLRIVEVKSRYGHGTDRCFNFDLWDQLSAKQVGESIAREKKRDGKKVDKQEKKDAAKDRAPTPEELKKRAEQHNKRLYRHRIDCLQLMLSKHADSLTDEQLQLFTLTMAIRGGGYQRTDFLRAAAKSHQQKLPGTGHATEIVGAIDRKKLRPTLIEFFRHWCKLEARSCSSDPDPKWIEWLASDMKIDFAGEWRVSEEFLAIHTVDQLRSLMVEWKILQLSDGSKSGLIKGILAQNLNTKLPVPKELLNVRPCPLD